MCMFDSAASSHPKLTLLMSRTIGRIIFCLSRECPEAAIPRQTCTRETNQLLRAYSNQTEFWQTCWIASFVWSIAAWTCLSKQHSASPCSMFVNKAKLATHPFIPMFCSALMSLCLIRKFILARPSSFDMRYVFHIRDSIRLPLLWQPWSFETWFFQLLTTQSSRLGPIIGKFG